MRVAIVALGLAIASMVSFGDARAQADAPWSLDFGRSCQDAVDDSPRLASQVLPRSKPGAPWSAPVYPPESRIAGEDGRAVVRLLVTESGEVSQAWIFQSTGFPRLDAAALEATRTWRMQPGTVEGKPRCMWGKFAITFHIDEHLAEEITALVPEARPFASALIRSVLVTELLSWPDRKMKVETLECALQPIDGALKRKDAADVFVDGVLTDKYRVVVARHADTAMSYCICLLAHTKKAENGSAPSDDKVAACGAPPSFE